MLIIKYNANDKMGDYLKHSRFMLKWHYVHRQKSKMSIFYALAVFCGTDETKIYEFGEEALEKYMKETNRKKEHSLALIFVIYRSLKKSLVFLL